MTGTRFNDLVRKREQGLGSGRSLIYEITQD